MELSSFKDAEVIEESSNAPVNLDRQAACEEGDEMLRLFQSQLRLNIDEELLIHVNVNVTVGLEKSHVDGRRKGRTQLDWWFMMN
ncbi:Hypothetical predicted protein [Olea europaea subsp. europaea]|uniref:Uncharacterized protein n=1 Tax=Olea europaea subsp. europaea TaxID=158383 RepID=A0A8S0UT32_OLEEU|nr:Hypothetical predicted protein [Olea europaea subsp. europaea]